MKLFSIIFFVLFFAQASQAQTCPTGLLHLQSQVEVDSFPINYPECTSLPEGLLIGIYSSDNDVNNLDSLSQVTSIGDLLIFNSALTNCSLPNLTDIDKFYIYGNDNLESLSGLAQLNSVAGDFSIESNENLVNLSGLSSLNSISGKVDILDNSSLASLGMSQLNSISGKLSIENNPGLESLGLPSLSTTGQISIYGNDNLVHIVLPSLKTSGAIGINQLVSLKDLSLPMLDTVPTISINETGLESLSGLSSLETVSGDMYIRANNLLINFTGLTNLNTIEGDFYIYENDNLANFMGLSSIESISGFLSVYENKKLANLAGMESLKSVVGLKIGGSVVGNVKLTSLKGLSGLESAGAISIRKNTKLNNLNELTSLNAATAIDLRDNAQLSDISGLKNVDADELSFVTIKNNMNLAVCNIESICDFLQISNSNNNIANNKEGCTSYQEVILACSPSIGILLSCPEDISTVIPSGASDVTVSWNEAIVTTNCASSSDVNLSSTIASGTAFGVGLYTVTYEATDDCSNVSSCSFTITVGPSPASLDINITNCPTAYPNSGDDYFLGFSMTNTGGLASDPMSFDLVQPYIQTGDEEYSGVGSVSIPAINPGETYSSNHNFGAVASYPSDFKLTTWQAYFSNSYQLRTNFGPGEDNYVASIDLFCKKFDSQLKVEVNADSYLIDANGNLEYDITVSNLGSELAANIMTHVGPTLWGKNGFTLSNKPAGSKEWRSKDNKEDLFLDIPLLEAGSSKTFHVAIHIQGEIDAIFEPNVYVYSHHQINEQINNDITEAKFYKAAADLSITNLLNLPTGGLVADVVDFNFDLNNMGNITAMAEYKIGMYLSTDSIYDSGDVLIGEIVTAQTAVGTVEGVLGSITVPDMTPAEYYLILVADVNEAIVEANENNNSLSTKFSILNPSGVKEISQNTISIQPNPATDLIKIITQNKLDKVMVYNVFGQLVLEGAKSEFSVAHLPKGVYAVVVHVAEVPVVSHFVVQ